MNKYRTFGPRFWAGFIDGLVLLPITFLDHYLSSPTRGRVVLIGWAIVSYSAYWLYDLLHARDGQTVGKKAMGVKVLDLSEERTPSLWQAFLRECGYVFLNTVALVYVVYLVATQAYLRNPRLLNDNYALMILGWAGLA